MARRSRCVPAFPAGSRKDVRSCWYKAGRHEQVHRIEVRDGIGIAAAAVLRPADRGQAFELSLLRPSADPADIWELEIGADAAQTGGETVRFSIALRTDGAAVVEGPIWDTAADGSAPPQFCCTPSGPLLRPTERCRSGAGLSPRRRSRDSAWTEMRLRSNPAFRGPMLQH